MDWIRRQIQKRPTETSQSISPNSTRTNTRPLSPRYYWRSLTYDRYTGRGWRAGRTKTLDYEAGVWVVDEPRPELQLVQQKVQVVDEGDGLAYAAGSLLNVDQDYRVAWRTNDEGDPVLDSFGASFDGKSYQAQSQIPIVSQAQLRAEGSVYPDWIKERYLSLPDSVPAQVLALARDLTATEPTPYDRAKAIEGYLRAFPYTLDLPAPPRGRDIAGYFLFDLRRGYCDYYATTMAVMSRAAGLPARLTVGYASGDYDATEDRYIVTAANAHSWVEIYFPTYGWVPFEPSAGLPAIERPDGIAPVDLPEAEMIIEPDISLVRRPGIAWLPGLAATLALLLLGVVAWTPTQQFSARQPANILDPAPSAAPLTYASIPAPIDGLGAAMSPQAAFS